MGCGNCYDLECAIESAYACHGLYCTFILGCRSLAKYGNRWRDRKGLQAIYPSHRATTRLQTSIQSMWSCLCKHTRGLGPLLQKEAIAPSIGEVFLPLLGSVGSSWASPYPIPISRPGYNITTWIQYHDLDAILVVVVAPSAVYIH
jgi:hypothetical protein